MKKKAVIGLFTSGAVLAGLIAATAIPALAEEGEPGIAAEPLTVNTVYIDIKPDSDENPINNNGKGVIPIAILGSADFDVSQIDPATIMLDGCSIKVVGKTDKLLSHIEDVDGDGYLDLIVQIQDVDGTFMDGDTEATLTGNLKEEFGSTPIEGTDTIWIVPNNQSELYS